MLNCDGLKQTALELLGADLGINSATLTPLNLGLSNDNFEFRLGAHRYLLKAYRSDLPEGALIEQQFLADAYRLTTRPIAWHKAKRVALFEFWPGEVYQGSDWHQVIPLLVKMHKSAPRGENSEQRWCIDVPTLLSTLQLPTPLINAFDVSRIIGALSDYPRFSAYCHNDLVRDNILCNGSDIRLIDFEYAGWHDVYFDLAALATSFKLNESHAGEMLVRYHELMQGPHDVLLDKLKDYRLAYLSLSVEWYEQRGYKQEANRLLSQLPKWT